MNGVTWEDTGIYEHMAALIAERGREVDGCINRDDIIDRYNRLDSIFDQIKMERRLRTRQELDPRNFREVGGIYVHIGPAGELYFGGGGCHRFAIARVLKLPMVPAQIGCVHQSAIPLLPTLRQRDRAER